MYLILDLLSTRTLSIWVGLKVTIKYQNWDPLEEIRLAFKLFVGDDQSGKISVRSLRRVARELNEQISEEELKSMIEEFDFD